MIALGTEPPVDGMLNPEAVKTYSPSSSPGWQWRPSFAAAVPPISNVRSSATVSPDRILRMERSFRASRAHEFADASTRRHDGEAPLTHAECQTRLPRNLDGIHGRATTEIAGFVGFRHSWSVATPLAGAG